MWCGSSGAHCLLIDKLLEEITHVFHSIDSLQAEDIGATGRKAPARLKATPRWLKAKKGPRRQDSTEPCAPSSVEPSRECGPREHPHSPHPRRRRLSEPAAAAVISRLPSGDVSSDHPIPPSAAPNPFLVT